MLNYIFYEDPDDLFFEFNRELKDYKKLDCEECGFDGILKIESPSLFKSKNNYIFYNAQKLGTEELIPLIEQSKSTNKLAFLKIDKRTKVYKKIVREYKYQTYDTLSSVSIKKDFIRTILIENNLQDSLTTYFTQNLPENKSIIESEIGKFSKILHKTNNLELAKKSVCVYGGNTDIFEFMNALFDRSLTNYYYYLNKIIDEVHPIQVYTLLSKKFMYLILLSLNKEAEAKSYIFASNYYLKIDSKLAKKLGSQTLIKIHNYISANLFDVYEDKSLRLRLLDLFNFYTNGI